MKSEDVSRFEVILSYLGLAWMIGDPDYYDGRRVIRAADEGLPTVEDNADLEFVLDNATAYGDYLEERRCAAEYDASIVRYVSRRQIDRFYQPLIF